MLGACAAMGLNRTYEELKLLGLLSLLVSFLSLNRTYEELKLFL